MIPHSVIRRKSEEERKRGLTWAKVANLAILESNLVEVFSGGITIPNVDALVLQGLGTGVPADEPEELLGQPTPEDPLGGQEGKRLAQVEPHLVSKLGHGSNSWETRKK